MRTGLFNVQRKVPLVSNPNPTILGAHFPFCLRLMIRKISRYSFSSEMIAGLLKSTFIVQPSQIGYKSRLSTLSPTQTAPGKPVDRLPRGYFESDRNQKSHLETVVAPRLGIIQLEDWYSITVERARKAGGSFDLQAFSTASGS